MLRIPLDRPLLAAGMLSLAALVFVLGLMQTDDWQLLGINVWIKPAKS